MLSTQVFEVKLLYECLGEFMTLRQYLGDVTPTDLPNAAREIADAWQGSIFPALIPLWSNLVRGRQVYVRQILPAANIPHAEPISVVGLRSSQAIPLNSALRATGYSDNNPAIVRGTYRLSGIAEDLQNSGILNSEGTDLAAALSSAWTETIPIYGSDPGVFRLGAMDKDQVFRAWAEIQCRSNLGTQRTRLQRPGITA